MILIIKFFFFLVDKVNLEKVIDYIEKNRAELLDVYFFKKIIYLKIIYFIFFLI